jgi:hypothetical protein
MQLSGAPQLLHQRVSAGRTGAAAAEVQPATTPGKWHLVCHVPKDCCLPWRRFRYGTEQQRT